MEDLKKRTSVGIGFNLVIIYVILFSGNYYARHPEFSNQFLTLVTAICLVRLIHLFVSQRISSSYFTLDKQIFVTTVALTGIIWGIGLAKFMFQDGESEAKLFMVMCTIGLCSGHVVSFVPALGLSILFSIFMLGPAIALMAFHQINLPLVILISLFLVYMIFMAKRGNKEYRDALETERMLKKQSTDLEKMSRTDPLTGLHNRRHFDQLYEFEWKLATRNQTFVSVIICDIDYFKKVNDHYGHLAGDAYLKKIAETFKGIFKRETDIVARYGGEEFIIVVSGEPQERVVEIAERVRISIENLILKFEEEQIQTTLSLGIATDIPRPTDHRDSLISKADEALYQSKANGRNQITTSG